MTRRLTSSYPKGFRWIHRVTHRCERCRRFGAETHHQNTRYVDEESNIVCLCSLCKQENDEYWAEMWRELYSNIL